MRVNFTGDTEEEKVVTLHLFADMAVDSDLTEVRIVVNNQRVATLRGYRVRKTFNND